MARKAYSEEFRESAVKLAREARRVGRSVDRVAREVGVHPNSLREWVRNDDSMHAYLSATPYPDAARPTAENPRQPQSAGGGRRAWVVGQGSGGWSN
jgi:transposase-like protein